MRTSFLGIEIGKRAIIAQRLAIDVTGHNIANVNTPGFSRQDAVMAATQPYSSPGSAGMVGTGVQVTDIRRIRDAFLDMQARIEFQSLGRYSTLSKGLEEIEVILAEPSDSGLRSVLDRFWAALQELSVNPEGKAVRTTVTERAAALADALGHTYRQLTDLQRDADASIRGKVAEVNTITSQIAELNTEIARARSRGENPNDLMDRRDLLVDRLAHILEVRTYEDPIGWMRVTINGISIVDAEGRVELKVEEDARNYARVVWGNTGKEVTITGGEIAGYRSLRDEVTAALMADLDALAQSIIFGVNAQHTLGFDLNGTPGGAFFEGNSASTMSVSSAIVKDTAKIAASSTGMPGDGSNALAMARLKQALTMRTDPSNPPDATWDDFIRGFVNRVGVDAEDAKRMYENETLLVKSIENSRQSVCGVSLDEEMTNLVRFQHAYTAAARLITVADEMLETLITRMGVVGR